MRKFLILFAAVCGTFLISQQAEAQGFHHGRGWGGSGVSISVGRGFYGPGFYGSGFNQSFYRGGWGAAPIHYRPVHVYRPVPFYGGYGGYGYRPGCRW